MKIERDCFEEIDRLVEKGLKSEAERKLNELCEQVKNKPNYGGYYWIAKSYYSLNKKKYATKILENINSASEFIQQCPNQELPHTAWLLKARAYSHLKQFDLGITACDEVLKKKQDGEAYYIRGILKLQITQEDNDWEDLKKAEDLGNKEAKEFLKNRNFKKKR